MEGWESPQPPPVCSIHLDDGMAAKLRQNALHTPAYCAEETEFLFKGNPGIFKEESQ